MQGGAALLDQLVRKLGLRVSWKKVVSPTKHVTFLGVDIDTNDCVLSLGADKLMLNDKRTPTSIGKGRQKCNCRTLLAR